MCGKIKPKRILTKSQEISNRIKRSKYGLVANYFTFFEEEIMQNEQKEVPTIQKLLNSLEAQTALMLHDNESLQKQVKELQGNLGDAENELRCLSDNYAELSMEHKKYQHEAEQEINRLALRAEEVEEKAQLICKDSAFLKRELHAISEKAEQYKLFYECEQTAAKRLLIFSGIVTVVAVVLVLYSFGMLPIPALLA